MLQPQMVKCKFVRFAVWCNSNNITKTRLKYFSTKALKRTKVFLDAYMLSANRLSAIITSSW